jgi:hypothetical protein
MPAIRCWAPLRYEQKKISGELSHTDSYMERLRLLLCSSKPCKGFGGIWPEGAPVHTVIVFM